MRWPWACAVLLHVAALALAVILTLPRLSAPPLEYLRVDLSKLDSVEGGGGEGDPLPQQEQAAPLPPAPPQARAQAPLATAASAPVKPAPQPARKELAEPGSDPQPPAPSTPGPAAEGQAQAAGGGAAGGSQTKIVCPWLQSQTGGGGEGVGPGFGRGLSGIPREYLVALRMEIERHKTYPDRARRLGWEGEVRVRFDVDRDGRVSAVEVAESSGCGELDAAATDTLRRIGHLPPLPSSTRLSRLHLELPMVYRLTR